MSAVDTPDYENIESLLDEAAAKYLKNKLKGGRSNEVGNTYESNFAVWMIAKTASDVFEGKVSDQISLATQAPNFVDDFVVFNKVLNTKESYQLKNSPKIYWNGGDHPITTDFSYHHRLDLAEGVLESLTVLTVSCEKSYKRLSNSIPDSIKAHSSCLYFPYYEKPNVGIMAFHDLRRTLASICIEDEPDKLDHLHTVIKGVWLDYKGTHFNILDFINLVREIKPEFVRYPGCETVLESEVRSYIDKIDGFSYQLSGSKLIFEYNSSNGVLKGIVDLGDDTKLMKFTSAIVGGKPSSFRELWELGVL